MSHWKIAFAITAVLLLASSSVYADQVTFNLTQPNAGGLDCCTGPYASVTVDRTSATSATVTFDSLTNGGYIYLLAGAQSADLNINATSFIVDSITATNSLTNFKPWSLAGYGAQNAVDGFGSFNLSIDSFDGFTHSATEMVINLTNNDAGGWASAGDVLLANNNGSTAAMHGFACAVTCDGQTSSAFATGYASNGTEVETPEPATLSWLIGFGAVLAFVLQSRKPIRTSN